MTVFESSATFSPCRRYRYTLWRGWRGLLPSGKGYAMFVCLNPSTADETQDDPMVRRCIGYAQLWGFEGVCVTNLFAYRATDPAVMRAADDPIGLENDAYLRDIAERAGIVVAAWGNHGAHRARDAAVRALLPVLHVLRLTRGGHPGHPLYLPKTLLPFRWDQAEERSR